MGSNPTEGNTFFFFFFFSPFFPPYLFISLSLSFVTFFLKPEVALEFVGKKFAALSASITKTNPQNLQKTSLEVVYLEACDTQISSIMNGVNASLLDPANPEVFP